MLVEWGVELADRDGLECFVGASDQGKHVYSKFGFLPGGTFEIDGYTVEFYIRPAKKQRSMDIVPSRRMHDGDI